MLQRIEKHIFFYYLRRPTQLSEDVVNECTKYHEGPFCDYQEFGHTADGTGFEVRTRNNIDRDMIDFWDKILQ